VDETKRRAASARAARVPRSCGRHSLVIGGVLCACLAVVGLAVSGRYNSAGTSSGRSSGQPLQTAIFDPNAFAEPDAGQSSSTTAGSGRRQPREVILAARVTQSQNDTDQLKPMVTKAAAARREAGIEQPIGTVLTDGGYWNSPAISEVRGQ
jgi:hypothetical protein